MDDLKRDDNMSDNSGFDRNERNDNRTLLEKLKEPGQRNYNVLYDHIARLSNPQKHDSIVRMKKEKLAQQKTKEFLENKQK